MQDLLALLPGLTRVVVSFHAFLRIVDFLSFPIFLPCFTFLTIQIDCLS